ncbi:hypothetical protein IP91_02572 [Pseudoduganella lurida]|uniref:Glycine-rich domain-containing protein n=1 Tax=Pseudoduganella lurida TaxID=1036180 RepID=A0A562R7Y0_9BURK|nr:hypothetical protein [Pseudoduganella lurida]TWI65165.1 hypothetical protein IP91_02572 [Pseudoduganella lurida]
MTTVIKHLPPGPNTNDPENFDPRADAVVAAFNPMIDEINLVNDEMNTSAAAVAQSVVDARSARDEAQGYRNDANGARNQAVLAKGDAQTAKQAAEAARDAAQGYAIALTGTSISPVVIGLGNKQFTGAGLADKQFFPGQRVRVANPANIAQRMDGVVTVYVNSGANSSLAVAVDNVDSSTSGSAVANWRIVPGGEPGGPGPAGGINGGSMSGALNFKEANAVPVSATPDVWSPAGNVIPMTGNGTITGLPDAPQVGAWRTLVLRGVTTLTTSANFQVYGGTMTLAAGDIVHVVAEEAVSKFRVFVTRRDGKAVVGGRTVTVYLTGTQMWPVPATDLEVIVQGGGQSGTNSGSAGGWCGAYAKKRLNDLTIGAMATVSVGLGGVVSTSNVYNDGGNSSFALTGVTTILAEGGKSAGAAATGGDFNLPGVMGERALPESFDYYSGYGDYAPTFRSGRGADGLLGYGAYPKSTEPNANGVQDAVGFGSGGAGVVSSSSGGAGVPQTKIYGSAGRPGVVIVTYQI